MSKKEFASELHRRVIKKFACRRVMAYGIDNIWGLDIADINSLMKIQ